MNNPRDNPTDEERMGALEPLAGGLAHDLNNIFAVILSNVRFAMESLGDHPAGDDLRDIETAARRGVEVVDRLRGIGGRQALRPVRVGLSALVARMAEALVASVGEGRLALRLCEDTGAVFLDKARLEQSLLALAVFAARLSEPDGAVTVGVLETEEEDTRFSVLEVRCGAVPGDWSEENLFEPYRPIAPDVKSGLELAAARGLMVRSGGRIGVVKANDSLVISVRFPMMEEPASP